MLLSSVAQLSVSAITFEDVGASATDLAPGPTAGSAWGDANADGWPDLWVSNHHGLAPALLINQRDGSFRNEAASLPNFVRWERDGWPDFHGAAWADYDNDGDQDIVVVTGAGAGRGASANHLFVNSKSGWVDSAQKLGLDYPLGRGRTPLWFDANKDGKLDLLVMNKDRATAPSALFLQVNGNEFSDAIAVTRETSWWQSMSGFFAELFGLEDDSVVAAAEFPILLSPDEVVTFDRSSAIRRYNRKTLIATDELSVGKIRSIQDAAAADFDGDQRTDLFLLRSQTFTKHISRPSHNSLRAVLNGTVGKPAEIEVVVDSDLKLGMYRPWRDPSDPLANEPLTVRNGRDELRIHDSQFQFLRSSSVGDAPKVNADSQLETLQVSFDAEDKRWTIRNSAGPLNLEVEANIAMDTVQAVSFEPSTGALQDVLLANTDQGFVATNNKLSANSCQSVVAADFDNDTDTDLYLTCSEPTRDAADIYLENDGHGNFTPHEQPTAPAGRGNQASAADFDNDGFIDLAITQGAGAPPWANRGQLALLRNTGNNNNWLQIRLVGRASNRDGVGAEVILNTESVDMRQIQDSGVHSFSQDHSRLHFGLGRMDRVDTVVVRWPSGAEQRLINVAANQQLEIVELESGGSS